MPKGSLALIVDHGLRAESADEAAQTAEMAEQLGLQAQILTWQHGEIPRTQAAYRAGRYALLAQACQREGVGELWTGHHWEDQCETLMLRLSKGSGLAGLSGMAQRSWIGDTRLVRPLLVTSKSKIRARVADLGLQPIEDPSNSDAAYPRVAWRSYLSQQPALSEYLSAISKGVGALRNKALSSLKTDMVAVTGLGMLSLNAKIRELDGLALQELLSACARYCGGRPFPATAPLSAFVRSNPRIQQRAAASGVVMSWLSYFCMAPENRKWAATERDRWKDHPNNGKIDVRLMIPAGPMQDARLRETKDGLWYPGDQMKKGGIIVGSKPRFDHFFATEATPCPLTN